MTSKHEESTGLDMPPVFILCGGQGTRLREVSEVLPKPMVPIGSYPIVWHIMKTYASFGCKRFVLCLGYKREIFINYFLNYHAITADATVKLKSKGVGEVTYHGHHDEADWEITLANTGEETMTGARIYTASKYLKPEDERFFLTYGDGVANINIDALLKSHLSNKKLLTTTAVHTTSRFGEMLLEGDDVLAFREKHFEDKSFINGGYMVLEKKFIDNYLNAKPSLTFEQEPMMKAMADGEMGAYRHNGFWQCMDTAREFDYLNDLWRKGEAPWKESWKI